MKINCRRCNGFISFDEAAYWDGEFDFVCPNYLDSILCGRQNTVKMKDGKVKEVL
jgi:hypothetical protein